MNAKPENQKHISGQNQEGKLNAETPCVDIFAWLFAPPFSCLDSPLAALGCDSEQIGQLKSELDSGADCIHVPFCDGILIYIPRVFAKRIRRGTVLYMCKQTQNKVSKREAEMLAERSLEKLNSLGIFMGSQRKNRKGRRVSH